MRIPFTKYNVNVTKRGVSFFDNEGLPTSFNTWSSPFSFTKTTPILESVYDTIAKEISKIDLKHILETEKYEIVNDELNYLLTLRPNILLTASSYKEMIAYQTIKYGNSLTYINREFKKGKEVVTSLEVIDVNDYLFGNGYQINDKEVFLKLKRKSTNEIVLINYRDVIHLRLHPNNIFNGDKYDNSHYDNFIKLFDKNLDSLIKELSENGTVKGIVTVGTSHAPGLNGALVGNSNKIEKQREIIERIKKSKGGVLVLDSGEEWKSLAQPFKTMNTQEIDTFMKYLFNFIRINQKVIDGTADENEMEVFFNSKCLPFISNLIEEMTYKIFTKEEVISGHRIDYYINPFEYVNISKAIDNAYKGAMDTTTNERRRMIYKLPPVEGGDMLMKNLNFKELSKEESEEELKGGE